MSFGIRAVTIAGLAGVALGACYLLLVWTDNKGWVSSLLLGEVIAERNRLEITHAEVLERMRAGEARIIDLSQGRATLREVAAEMIAMHEDQPIFCECLARRYPGQTDLERVARAVANRAYYEVEDLAQREKLGRQLIEEFRTTFPSAEPFAFDSFPDPMPTPAPPPGPELGPPQGVPMPLPRPIAIPILGPPPR
jgi:hypothetical protein